MKRPIVLVLIVVLLVGGAGVFFWLQHATAEHQLVESALPPQPDLSKASPILRARLAEIAEQLDQRGHDVSALKDLSRLYHANGFISEAAVCYAGLERLDPSEPRWWYRHSTILAGYGEAEPAIAQLEKTIALAPNYVPAKLRLADAYLKLNQADKAAEIYRTVLQQDKNPYALLGLARIDYEAGRLEKAREQLEPLVKETNFQLGYDLIVEVYERLGQSDRAEAIRGTARASGAYRDPDDPWMDELLDDCFDTYLLALAAGAADRMGKMDTAIHLLERATQYAPGDVSPRFQLGSLYSRHGDMRAALDQFTQCTTMAPDFSDGWAFLSDALSRLGDNAAASRALLAGLSHCPDSPGLHLMRARELRKSGQTEAALEEFRATIRLRPNEADAYVEMGNCLIGLGRTDEGVEALKQSLVAEPDNPIALSVLAYHAISTHNEPLARQWLTRVKAQPRVAHGEADQLFAAYRQTFGKDF